MAQVTLEGIVLRHANYRDNDRMLTLLSPTHGRVEVLSRGCRRPKSPLMSASEVFVSGEFVLFQKQDRYILTGCAIRDTFYSLRLSPYRLTCASYVLQLCEAAAQPAEDSTRLVALLLAALRAMCGGLRDEPLKAVAAFLIRFADVIGYRPTLNACAVCGEIVPDAPSVPFDLEAGGVCCRRCADLRALRVTRVQRDWMRRMLGERGEEMTPVSGAAGERTTASGAECAVGERTTASVAESASGAESAEAPTAPPPADAPAPPANQKPPPVASAQPEVEPLFTILRRYVEMRLETTIRCGRFLP